MLVHGGGDIVTEYSRKMGVEPRIVVHPNGMKSRYTSLEELEIYTMVMAGLLNKRIVSGLEYRGIKALGVSGADLGLLAAERKKRIIILNERGRMQVIPGGYTGKIRNVQCSILCSLLGISTVLVVSPIALGLEGELLNVNGDQASALIATSLEAEKLIFLSDVPGVLLEDGVIRVIRTGDVEDLYIKIGPGMNRKVVMAAEAVSKGVGEAIIADGTVENPITTALAGSGTRIVP
ncbi:MAG: [Desulfurococcales archaeon]|nr:[LysW]-aminoadipate/[LysW]-glutamate kinase [Desulfurococcales archaeon]